MKTINLPGTMQLNALSTLRYQRVINIAGDVSTNQNFKVDRQKAKLLLLAGFVLLMTIMLGINQQVMGQCNTPNTNQWPNNAVNAGTGASVQISNQTYEGDYSRITGIISGAQYKFTINQATDIVTVRIGSSGGTILGFGTTGSAIVTATSTSDLYVHWNSSTCGTATSNRTSTVQGIPTITGLGSTNGCPGGSITITGFNFSGVTAANIKIGGTAVTSITTSSSTQIVAVTGSGTTGTVNVANSGGSGTSAATFTFNAATAIAGQPVAPAAICSGNGTQAMTVTATGTNLSYVWRKGTTAVVNGTVISGQGTPTLTLTNAAAADAGSYNVVVTGDCGSVTSNSVSVTIHPTPVSSVTDQTNITCNAANDGTITVSVTSGTSPYEFSVTEGAKWQNATPPSTTSSLFTGLSPNTPYKIKIRDAAGCYSK